MLDGFTTLQEIAMHALFLGGGSDGETMTLADDTTEVCTFGTGGERLHYVRFQWGEAHDSHAHRVEQMATFCLASVPWQEALGR
jgi:hypothetical protein